MKLKLQKHKIFYWILRFLFLALYIGCVTTLIVEAATPGKASSQHSTVVGTTIGGIINDINGDQAKEILPTGVKITNTQTDYCVGDTVTIKYNPPKITDATELDAEEGDGAVLPRSAV